MPLDLTAARALHDRDPNNPDACPTCIDPENPHQMARWPCATALALGATGRSEWEDGPVGTGTLLLPKIIEFDPRTETVTPDGTVVTTTPTPDGPALTRWPNNDNPCPLTSTSRGYLHKCVLQNGHLMPHHLGGEQSYTPCQHEYPGSYQCALGNGHDGNHRALNGGTL